MADQVSNGYSHIFCLLQGTETKAVKRHGGWCWWWWCGAMNSNNFLFASEFGSVIVTSAKHFGNC